MASGGKREGAGRKPTHTKITKTIKLNPVDLAKFQSKYGSKINHLVDSYLMTTEPFDFDEKEERGFLTVQKTFRLSKIGVDKHEKNCARMVRRFMRRFAFGVGLQH